MFVLIFIIFCSSSASIELFRTVETCDMLTWWSPHLWLCATKTSREIKDTLNAAGKRSVHMHICISQCLCECQCVCVCVWVCVYVCICMCALSCR